MDEPFPAVTGSARTEKSVPLSQSKRPLQQATDAPAGLAAVSTFHRIADVSPMSLNKILVSTKFAPPRVGSRYILRKQLLVALDQGKDCKLILATGSAGFGKTILLAQWRQELMKAGLPVTWLSLSHDERLLQSFAMHLFDALERLGVPLGNEVLLAGEGAASMDTIVAMLVNGLASIDDDLYLILDDYHHVEDAMAHRLVQKLLDHGPGNLHLVISSRAVPPISLSRLRVMGQVAEIECNDLPFDLAETRIFLEQNVSGIRFSADEVSEIHNVTHGWPASLQLLAISLKGRPESRTTVHKLAAESANLQNYLSEDVLARLSPALAHFMESISICRRFNATVAEAITGNDGASSLLQRIEDENLLVMRAESEDRSPWYRFHPLFAEFLMARLERRGTADVYELHRRASICFAEKGLVVEAIRHASLGHDVASAVTIIERTAPTTWSLRYFAPFVHLTNNLSPESIVSHPRLLYLGALTLAITGRRRQAAAWIAQMQTSDPVNTRDTAFRVALTTALSSLQSDDSARAIELLEPFSNRQSMSTFEQHMFVAVLAPSLAAAGRYAEAHELLDRAALTQDGSQNETALLATGCRTVVFLIEGRVVDAEQASTYNRSLAVHGDRGIWTSMSAASLASALYEQNRIDEACELLTNRLHMLATSSPEIMIHGMLSHARLDLLHDSTEAALSLLERQAAFFRSMGLDRPFAYAIAEQTRILVARADLQRASEISLRLEQLAASFEDADGFHAEIPAIAAMARARLESARGNHDEALQAVGAAQCIAERLGRGWMNTVVHVVTALILMAAGRTSDATSRLTDAMGLARQLGLVRTFLDEGEPMRAMLHRLRDEAESDPPTASYTDVLLRHFDNGSRPGTSDSEGGDARGTLTPREMEIVDLIAAGMSNKRIAHALNIRLETVKWNLKNVFVKLKVSSRYDATVRARRLGLIE